MHAKGPIRERSADLQPGQEPGTDGCLSEGSPVGMAKVLSHPLRFRILNDMNTPLRRLSPSQFSEEIGESLGNVSYHFRVLQRAGCIEIVDTIQRRGATEHVYEPVKRAMAWTREWEMLGPVVRQVVAASALGNAVRQTGAAIDAGTFDKRDDSHLSHDTLWIDEAGWEEIHNMFREHLEELLMTTQRITQRLEADPDAPRFLATYFMATFESPLRPDGGSLD
ncbi:MAG: ArsR/SmtB family transcription factor [Solirubrobacterales bacterium]